MLHSKSLISSVPLHMYPQSDDMRHKHALHACSRRCQRFLLPEVRRHRRHAACQSATHLGGCVADPGLSPSPIHPSPPPSPTTTYIHSGRT